MADHYKALYDDIGICYDDTRHADPEIANTISDLLGVSFGSNIIDVACGTGNYSIELFKLGYNVTAVDISSVMISKAQEKCRDINWLCNSADHIELNDRSFDGACCILACHHFNNLRTVFSEVYRLIRKGRFVILTCTHRQIRNYWLYRYYPEVLEYMTTYMPSIETMIESLSDSGFYLKSLSPFYITPDLKDNFLGARIEKPELYLQESFRKGMSIFATKADPSDIKNGCQRLEKELRSGVFHQYIKGHKNPYGDYLFITVEKR